MERIELCSNRCCPTLAKLGDLWIINDDYGGDVKLTSDQLDNLVKVKLKYEKDLASIRMIEAETARENGLLIQP